jgi:alanyl-tRNA synthetase
MSIDWIKKNTKVYSQEMVLKTAQRIPGLRAVFGETYPDPVRVVTLEYDLDTIAKDIENPKWRGTSVEFCGGTCVLNSSHSVSDIDDGYNNYFSHVSRTGDIMDFVITEESGIAKGIRRITAVTAHEAEEVKRVANSLRARLDRLEAMSGKEKDAGLKTFSVVWVFSFVFGKFIYVATGARSVGYFRHRQSRAS